MDGRPPAFPRAKVTGSVSAGYSTRPLGSPLEIETVAVIRAFRALQAVLLGERVQPRMTAIPEASSGDVSPSERTSPATPTIDSAQATQYVADSKMNVQRGQQGLWHSRQVTW
jgi:hypothetical protein